MGVQEEQGLPEERARPPAFSWSWRYRPAMSMRVAIGFAAVALTVIAANLITERSANSAREHVRHLLVQHEPLVRATETLAFAVSQYERSIVGATQQESAAAAEVAASQTRIAEALDGYETAARRFPEGDFFIPELRSEIEAFTQSGARLLERDQARRSRLKEYWSRFEKLEAQLADPQEKAARFAGAVFASESVMQLQRALSSIREKVSTATTVASPNTTQIVASENAFGALLKQYAGDLTTFHGHDWFEQVSRSFFELVAARRGVFDAIHAFEAHAFEFREEGARASSRIVTQLVGPARRALADADRVARHAAQKADRQLVWASATVLLMLIVIAVATVTSVTQPVRRLTAATRRIASGMVRTRVPRGGTRELDMLAAAFNQMAEQLERAEAEVRAYQAELEAKVDERTRELAFLAHHDPLTQLPNRRQLFSHLESSIARARRDGSYIVVLFIDLDNFKTINDSLGHEFGDSVLQAVSERLRSQDPCASAFSARFGGDEFTVICENIASSAQAERLCAAVLEQFQRSLLVHGRELRISVSIGASVYPDHADNSHALLRAADAALFRAKERGRSCWSMFAPELIEAASSRFKLEQTLRRAVEHGELELLYQPQVCFETRSTSAVEALVRWRLPSGEILGPSEFFDVADQSGLIIEMSDWALRTAIEAAAAWRRGPWPQARVAVNISSQQFLASDFVGRLDRLLRQHALSPECLEIELTENVLQTGPTTVAALHCLRELGVSIALDDFGTGYSSLTSLERLPLTRVKIDRSLIGSIDTGTRSPAIVRSIIGLCHSLGLQVTAEGVERPAQLGALLTDRGVQIQGFLVSRPLAVSAIADFVAAAPAHLEALLENAPIPETLEASARSRVLRLPLGRAAKK